jgi:hypothetical protein
VATSPCWVRAVELTKSKTLVSSIKRFMPHPIPNLLDGRSILDDSPYRSARPCGASARKTEIRERLGFATAGIGMQSNTGRSRPKDARAKGKSDSSGTGRGGVVVSLVAHRLNDAVDDGDPRVLIKRALAAQPSPFARIERAASSNVRHQPCSFNRFILPRSPGENPILPSNVMSNERQTT